MKQQLCRDGAVGRGRIVALQISFMFVGMLAVGAAIALAKRSMTGTSPISCIPAVLVDWLQTAGIDFVTLGFLTFCINALCLVGEILLLRRNFSVVQLLQIPAIFVLFLSIDCWGVVFAFVPMPNYPIRLLAIVLSIPVMSFGVLMQTKANVIMLPADAFVCVLSHVLDKPFHICKVGFDVSISLAACMLSVTLLGGVYDVREGTVLNAIFVGMSVKRLNVILGPGIDRLIGNAPRLVPTVIPV